MFPWVMISEYLTILRVYLVFGRMWRLLWQFLFAVGQNFIVAKGQILNKSSCYLVTLAPPR